MRSDISGRIDMDASNKVYQVSMMSIVNLLEECPEIPDIFGLNNDLLHRLRKLDSFGQKLITAKADKYLSIEINSEELQKQIDGLAEKIFDRELEDEHLTHHTPCKLMRELFGMHATEFCLRRKFLGLAGQNQHRPLYCDNDTELTIWKYWKETENMSDRERYLFIAKKMDKPINIIWAAARRYSESEKGE